MCKKMLSLDKILKLKAGVRATAQSRSFVPGVSNDSLWQLLKEEAIAARAPLSPCRPSVVSPSSPFACCASVRALKHGMHTGLIPSEPISRVLVTPPVHEPFRQLPQPLIDRADPEGITGLFGQWTSLISIRKAHDVIVESASKECNSDDRASPKRLAEDSRSAFPSLKPELGKEKRWRGLGFVVKEAFPKRASLTEFSGNCVESLGQRMYLREDGARTKSVHFEDHFGKFLVLSSVEKIEALGNPSGVYPRNAVGNAATCGLESSRNRSAVVQSSNGRAITLGLGCLFTRASHGVGLAGEGVTSDRSSDSERPPAQPAGDGNSLKLLSGACNIPHPDKIKTGGEDAYFICPNKHVVGVADGVGGWADLGIDAGEYARELMSQSMIAVHQQPPGSIDPAYVMEKAHDMTKCKGSSTVCILALTDTVLAAANLGDSGFVLVRNFRTVFKSPIQQHQFNIPFQLESGGSDPPSAAQVFSLKVADGDVIVAGTDGLFDNLYDGELTTLIVQAVRGHMAPDVTAQKIAELARARAQDKNRATPFSTAARDAGFRFYGGKMDDITVIVSYITNRSETSVP